MHQSSLREGCCSPWRRNMTHRNSDVDILVFQQRIINQAALWTNSCKEPGKAENTGESFLSKNQWNTWFDLIPALLFASNGIDLSMTFWIKHAPYDCYSLPSMLLHIQLQSPVKRITWPWQNSSDDFTASCMEAFGRDRRRSPRFDWYFDCNSAAASLVRSIFTVYKRSPYSAFKAYQTRSLRDGKEWTRNWASVQLALRWFTWKAIWLVLNPHHVAHLLVFQ